ncbi:MAG: ATP-binding protein [Bdellovibrionales bacterium]|nr:ATP-binding protein [Bdellovibrionales bacterium]
MGEIGTIQEEQVAVNSKKIISTVERISSIVKSLKKLSHGKVDSEYEHLLVTDIFHEVESIIVAKLKASNVSIEFNLEDETLEFNGSLTLIGQVLLNLITNSVQAIEENEEKWVKVSGETTHDSIFITVRDSGPGISPDVAENIFNPFFTTKSVGEGTGIGLALCRTAIERMNGKLYLNEKSPNTEFVIVLPKTSSKSLIQKESA